MTNETNQGAHDMMAHGKLASPFIHNRGFTSQNSQVLPSSVTGQTRRTNSAPANKSRQVGGAFGNNNKFARENEAYRKDKQEANTLNATIAALLEIGESMRKRANDKNLSTAERKAAEIALRVIVSESVKMNNSQYDDRDDAEIFKD
jgi:cell shape-determining protein MreC